MSLHILTWGQTLHSHPLFHVKALWASSVRTLNNPVHVVCSLWVPLPGANASFASYFLFLRKPWQCFSSSCFQLWSSCASNLCGLEQEKKFFLLSFCFWDRMVWLWSPGQPGTHVDQIGLGLKELKAFTTTLHYKDSELLNFETSPCSFS